MDQDTTRKPMTQHGHTKRLVRQDTPELERERSYEKEKAEDAVQENQKYMVS